MMTRPSGVPLTVDAGLNLRVDPRAKRLVDAGPIITAVA